MFRNGQKEETRTQNGPRPHRADVNRREVRGRAVGCKDSLTGARRDTYRPNKNRAGRRTSEFLDLL